MRRALVACTHSFVIHSIALLSTVIAGLISLVSLSLTMVKALVLAAGSVARRTVGLFSFHRLCLPVSVVCLAHASSRLCVILHYLLLHSGTVHGWRRTYERTNQATTSTSSGQRHNRHNRHTCSTAARFQP